MVAVDGLAERPRPAVHHQPEPAILVRLKFNEVIPAAERCELDRAFSPPDRLQAAVTKRLARQVRGLRNGRAAIAPASRHSPTEIGQNLAGDSRDVQGRGIEVQADLLDHDLEAAGRAQPGDRRRVGHHHAGLEVLGATGIRAAIELALGGAAPARGRPAATPGRGSKAPH